MKLVLQREEQRRRPTVMKLDRCVSINHFVLDLYFQSYMMFYSAYFHQKNRLSVEASFCHESEKHLHNVSDGLTVSQTVEVLIVACLNCGQQIEFGCQTF